MAEREQALTDVRPLLTGALIVASIAFVLFIHGAVPFVSIPTLPQALWSMGFSQSFVNQSLSTLYATNFGLPEPAPISFGLSGSLPAALLIALGLHPAEAYTTMVAGWLVVAYAGAFGMARHLGATRDIAALGAVVWMTLPVLIGHGGLSMLSLGMALLPLYLLATWRLLQAPKLSRTGSLGRALALVGATLVAVFMDGYTFMMFATASLVLWSQQYVARPDRRHALLWFGIPTLGLAFGVAYGAYALYVGSAQFAPAPLSFFRGWGADVTFWLIPTRGVIWLADVLGLSIERPDHEWFGDAWVWRTSFCAPLLVVGVLSWWWARRSTTTLTGVLIVSLLGLYLSLGPSLKVASRRPAALIEQGDLNQLMPADLALVPTGSGLLSAHLPGFQSMRASYRWVALALVGFWMLTIAGWSGRGGRRDKTAAAALLVTLIAFNLPRVPSQWRAYRTWHEAFHQIDADLLPQLDALVDSSERIAFLPFGNDFLVNYLTARLDLKTYNIGGDKNLKWARRDWPVWLRQFRQGEIDRDFAARVALVLSSGEVDAVVLPYIDLLWAAHRWPAPLVYREPLVPVLKEMKSLGVLSLEERRHFATVRVAESARAEVTSGALTSRLLDSRCLPPFCLERSEASLGELPRGVGIYENGSIRSDGREGFVFWGPYVPFEPGDHRLRVLGEYAGPGGGWIDVVSDGGRTVHARFPLEEHVSGAGRLEVDQTVGLGNAVKDLEVRVRVDERERLRVDRYELR